MVRTDEEIKEMKAAKEHETPDLVEGYRYGLKDGWLHALKWFSGD